MLRKDYIRGARWMGRKKADGATITIKKYANRRLYNTGTSSYITLEDLAAMVRQNVDFQVIDAKTGDDLTHNILTQIIMEEEANNAEQLLPVSFLRELIAMYGNSMQTMMPAYLEATMKQFRQNQEKLRETFEKNMTENPFARIAEGNLAMMRAAAGAFIPGAATKADAPPEPAKTDDLAELRKQMAAMQKRLDELG
jgi:polyhydroxyalkanoate synthesis repressor PhaR